MKLDEQQIDDLTENGRLQFTPRECAIIMGLPQHAEEFIGAAEDLDTPIGAAYQRGRLLAIAEVRRKVLEMAKQGSSPAQATFLQTVDRCAKASRRDS